MDQPGYTTEIGDLVVISITAETRTFIAEVTQSDPLRLKVTETGPFRYLKEEKDDFIVQDEETAQLQKGTNFLFKLIGERQVFTGLKSLGIEDNKLHELLLMSTKT